MSCGEVSCRRGVFKSVVGFLVEGRNRVEVGSVLEFEGEGDDGVCLIAAEGPAVFGHV